MCGGGRDNAFLSQACLDDLASPGGAPGWRSPVTGQTVTAISRTRLASFPRYLALQVRVKWW